MGCEAVRSGLLRKTRTRFSNHALKRRSRVRKQSQEVHLSGLKPATWHQAGPTRLEEFGESPPLAGVRTLFHKGRSLTRNLLSARDAVPGTVPRTASRSDVAVGADRQE
jgi:hypothetical protein